MLLEFKTNNYKSFKDELIFSMVPAPKQKGLDYSILQEKVSQKKYKGLSSAIIYGPNASGKTNIIGAMETFKLIILRGNILNNNDKNIPNAAAYNLELIPNCSSEIVKPVDFSLKFIENNLLFEYKISIDLGLFLDNEYNRKILSEILLINEKLVFSRSQELSFGDLENIQEYLVNDFKDNEESARNLAKSNLDDKELFLMNGFKTMFSADLVDIVRDWLIDKFLVIYRADSIHSIRQFSDPRKETLYIDKPINEAATLFGVASNSLGYIVSPDESEVKLYSAFKEKGTKIAIPAEIFESYGTIRFVNIFPQILTIFKNGGTLIVDEFDASIHPMAIMSIINIFHNDEINKKKAQLIFNTHNPIFLNANLFRRDEIKFTERDEETGESINYSLSDFKTSGKSGVRKNEDYLKNYFISRYGAINDIDFSPIFEKIWEENSI